MAPEYWEESGRRVYKKGRRGREGPASMPWRKGSLAVVLNQTRRGNKVQNARKVQAVEE